MTRRRFIGHANCAAISAVPVLNTLLNLRLAGSVAAANTSVTGYRALVCIFQSGGNDSFTHPHDELRSVLRRNGALARCQGFCAEGLDVECDGGPHICQRRFVCVTFTDDCPACQAEGIGNVSVGMFFDDDFESGHGANVTLEPRPGKQSPQISTCAESLAP